MQAPQHTLEEAEAKQAQLQQEVNVLHTAGLQLQEEEARCSLTESEWAVAVGAKWRGQKGEEEDDSEEEEVPEPPRTQLRLQQELHTAAVMHQEMTGELMQPQVTQCGSACNPVK